MLKLKLQSFGHLMQRTDSLEKTLMLGKIEGRWRRGDRIWNGWKASQTEWTWVWVNSGSWQWTGRPGVLQSMGSQRIGHDWATELNWTEVKWEKNNNKNQQMRHSLKSLYRWLFNQLCSIPTMESLQLLKRMGQAPCANSGRTVFTWHTSGLLALNGCCPMNTWLWFSLKNFFTMLCCLLPYNIHIIFT